MKIRAGGKSIISVSVAKLEILSYLLIVGAPEMLLEVVTGDCSSA